MNLWGRATNTLPRHPPAQIYFLFQKNQACLSTNLKISAKPSKNLNLPTRLSGHLLPGRRAKTSWNSPSPPKLLPSFPNFPRGPKPRMPYGYPPWLATWAQVLMKSSEPSGLSTTTILLSSPVPWNVQINPRGALYFLPGPTPKWSPVSHSPFYISRYPVSLGSQ